MAAYTVNLTPSKTRKIVLIASNCLFQAIPLMKININPMITDFRFYES